MTISPWRFATTQFCHAESNAKKLYLVEKISLSERRRQPKSVPTDQASYYKLGADEDM